MTGTAKSELPTVATGALPELPSGPKYLSIVSRHDIHLFWLAGDGRRFARLFGQAWGRLPLWARRKLLKHWRQTRPEHAPELPWPHIELIAGKSDFSRGNSDDAIAQTQASAANFAFDAVAMDTLPDVAVEAVIAHELAHAIYIINCRDEHMADAPYDEWGFSRAEYDADELAEYWGFDMEALQNSLSIANIDNSSNSGMSNRLESIN